MWLSIAATQTVYHGLCFGGLSPATSFGVMFAVAFVAFSPERKRTMIGRLRMLRTPPATPADLHHTGSGGCCRFAGIVEADEAPFPALGTETPAVFVRTTFVERDDLDRPTEAEDVRGVRFRVRLADGSTVRVNPETLRIVTGRRRLSNLPPFLREALGVFKPTFDLSARCSTNSVCVQAMRLSWSAALTLRPRRKAKPRRGAELRCCERSLVWTTKTS